MKKHRRSRYKRDSGLQDKKICLMPRDYIILSALSDYRFLTTIQITKLFFHSYDRACKRMWILWQHGLVERLFLPILGKEGSSQTIYGLNRKGARITTEKYERNLCDIQYLYQYPQFSNLLINHTLKRNDFRICLQLACQKRENAELLFWKQRPKEIGDKVYINDCRHNPIRVPLVPDGHFGLNTPQGRIYFMVEIDRTLGYKTYGLKLKGYYQWYLKNQHMEKFGTDNVRILTITYPHRLRRLIELAMTMRNDKKGSGIFWFTTFDQISLDKPENILCPIWKIAHQGKDGLHSIVQ